jgi:hypothetical protein
MGDYIQETAVLSHKRHGRAADRFRLQRTFVDYAQGPDAIADQDPVIRQKNDAPGRVERSGKRFQPKRMTFAPDDDRLGRRCRDGQQAQRKLAAEAFNVIQHTFLLGVGEHGFIGRHVGLGEALANRPKDALVVSAMFRHGIEQVGRGPSNEIGTVAPHAQFGHKPGRIARFGGSGVGRGHEKRSSQRRDGRKDHAKGDEAHGWGGRVSAGDRARLKYHLQTGLPRRSNRSRLGSRS